MGTANMQNFLGCILSFGSPIVQTMCDPHRRQSDQKEY